jgi:hypothetical protein
LETITHNNVAFIDCECGYTGLGLMVVGRCRLLQTTKNRFFLLSSPRERDDELASKITRKNEAIVEEGRLMTADMMTDISEPFSQALLALTAS